MLDAHGSKSFRTISLLIAVLLISFTSCAKCGGGTGEPNYPYQIATAEDLMLLGETPEDYDKHFILTADIDLDPNLPGRKVFDRAVIAPDVSEANWWFEGTPFAGVFNGNGHKILHLYIRGTGHLGLFGQLDSGAEISNIGLESVDNNGTGSYIGSLVGSNRGCVTTSYSTGLVSGRSFIGGLVGLNNGNIICSYSTNSVSGNERVGGLVGHNGGSITTTYSTGNIIGDRLVGGLVGRNSGNITMSYSTGTVTGNDEFGGFVGDNYNSNTKIESCFWNMETSGLEISDGGTGLTTAEMQDVNTYLNAGWDFIDEITNGSCDYWQISMGDYPRLHYHSGDIPLMPEGLGTTKQPYLIRDVRDLGTVWFKPTAHYRLESSINLSGITWPTAIVSWFRGTFDGNNCVISNLKIQGGSYLGLFGHLESVAEISNLNLEVIDVNGTGTLIGGLVGYNQGNVTDCHVNGTVNGNDHSHRVGGMVGSNSGSITNSHSTGSVSSTYWNWVDNNGSVGGLVGYNTGDVIYCHSTASVSHSGLYATTSVGGLVGCNSNGNIIMSYSTGTAIGERRVGGLVGRGLFGDITMSYSNGTVIGTRSIGGLVGENCGNITTCYSMSSVTGNKDVGGLVGQNYIRFIGESSDGNIEMSYSTGIVMGDEEVGGLIGDNKDGEIISCFWDIETSGQTTSAEGIGKTTAEMQTASTFLETGWDFIDETINGPNDVWKIVEGQTCPILSWQKYGGGTGEPDTPYLIYTTGHLNALGVEPNDWDKHFKLMVNIDLSEYSYDRALIAPDNDGVPFSGSFDGNSYAISNLTIFGEEQLGLFGCLTFGSEVKNLGVVNISVTGSGSNVGGLAGQNYGSITSSYSTGDVIGYWGVGGLVGYNRGKVTGCYAICTVQTDKLGYESSGGLIGVNAGGLLVSGYFMAEVSDCYSIVLKDSRVFGLLVGQNGHEITSARPGSITNCYASYIGTEIVEASGIVGYNWWCGEVFNSFWDSQASGVADNGEGGTPKTTAEMQTASTFLEAGWDFVDETENGTEDIWWIDEGKDYPRLWWELINKN